MFFTQGIQIKKYQRWTTIQALIWTQNIWNSDKNVHNYMWLICFSLLQNQLLLSLCSAKLCYNQNLLCNINLLTRTIYFRMHFGIPRCVFVHFDAVTPLELMSHVSQHRSNQVRRQDAGVQTQCHNLSIGHQSKLSTTTIHQAALLSHAGILRPVTVQQDRVSQTHVPPCHSG